MPSTLFGVPQTWLSGTRIKLSPDQAILRNTLELKVSWKELQDLVASMPAGFFSRTIWGEAKSCGAASFRVVGVALVGLNS